MKKYTISDIYNHHHKGGATLRFLPNIINDDSLPLMECITNFSLFESFIEVKGVSEELDGLYKNDPALGIEKIYAYLLNVKNDETFLEKINLVHKFYSYVLVVEDAFNPELNGKVMILEYDKPTYNLVNSLLTKKKTIVFDFLFGRNFIFNEKNIETPVTFLPTLSSIFDILKLTSEMDVVDYIRNRDCEIFKLKFDKKKFAFDKISKALIKSEN